MKSLATVLCIALAGILLLGVSSASAQNTDELTLVSVDPCRIVDTRYTTPGAFLPEQTREYVTYGGPLSAIPAQNGAAIGPNPYACPAPDGREPVAVSINVTAVPAQGASGHLRVWAADIVNKPTASMVNFTAGENVANQGTVLTWYSTAADPDIKIYASVATDVVVDVVGYWYPATNEIRDGSFQAGGAGVALYDPTPVDGIANRKFLTPPATVSVDGPGQLIHVVSSKAFGSTLFGGGRGLVLAICYERTDVPATITAVGPGVGNVNPIQFETFDANATSLQTLSAGFGVPAGNYDVGLCGYTVGGCNGCWDRNDAGYTTAFVLQQ